MVVDDLDDDRGSAIGLCAFESENCSPLIVQSDGMLSVALTIKLLEMERFHYPDVLDGCAVRDKADLLSETLGDIAAESVVLEGSVFVQPAQ